MNRKHTCLAILLLAGLALPRHGIDAGGNTPFNWTGFYLGVGVGFGGSTFISPDPSSGEWALKGVIDPQKATFRGKLKGTVVNQSNASATFKNDPLVHENLKVGLLPILGDSAEISQSKYKVSKKGKARGSFRGTYSIFG